MLSSTQLGREVGSDINARERIVYDHLFSVLSADEVANMNEMLDRVNTAMRDDGLPEPPQPTQDWAAVLDPKASSN